MEYTIIAVFVLIVLTNTISFFYGYLTHKKKADKERLEDMLIKAQADRDYENIKAEIKRETQGHAEQKKDSITGTGRDRFNAINRVMRNTD